MTCSSGRTTPASYSTRLRAAILWPAVGAGRSLKCLVTSPAGDKNLVTFEGDHNEMRPGFFLDSAAIFFTNVLRIPDAAALEVPTDHSGRPLPLMQVLLMQQRGAAARRHSCAAALSRSLLGGFADPSLQARLYGPRGGEATQAERARLRAEAQQEPRAAQQLEEEAGGKSQARSCSWRKREVRSNS